MANYPIIYARTKKGQLQQWQIEVEGNKFRTTEGIVNGTLTTSAWTICEGKSLGRANETTGDVQAEKEAASKLKKKLDSGYHENVADVDIAKFFEPMLAHKWSDYGEDMVYPFYCQPKLDGMRCITKQDGMFSRGGKPIKSAPHIRAFLEPIFQEFPDLVFDGELYNHALKHNFNKIISLAKKSKPTPEDLAESAEKLEYWVYDMFDPLHPEFIFSERYARLRLLIKNLNDTGLKIRFVFTYEVENLAQLDDLYKRFLDEGFEGQMTRTDAPYENNRTKALLKRKTFLEKEFKLKKIEAGKGNRAGLATIAYFEDERGVEFQTGVIGNNEYTAQLLKDEANYFGKMATVVFFEYTADEKVPRFGKMKIIRDYE